MNLTWHIVKKDLRRFRAALDTMLALIVPLLAILVLVYSWNWTHNKSWAQFVARVTFPTGEIILVFGVLAEMILLVYVVANALKEDAPYGDRAFWRTQPVSGVRIFVAKMIFIAIAMLPLQIMGQAIATLLTINPRNHFYEISGMMVGIEIAWASLAVYIGMSPPSSSTRLFPIWAFYIVSVVANVLYWLIFVTSHTHSAALTRLELKTFDAFLIYFALASAWLMYRYRSRKLVFLAYATGLLIANVAMTHFYLNL